MRVEWHGQSAFRLTADDRTVFIDPFGDVSGLAERGIVFEYPPIAGVTADLVLVTHEHRDHNGVEAIGGDPVVLRSTAGRLESPIGEVVAVASEHDPVAGTQRGPNTVFVFDLGGVRVCHFGDFGQASLRDEQAEAIGSVDRLGVPELLLTRGSRGSTIVVSGHAEDVPAYPILDVDPTGAGDVFAVVYLASRGAGFSPGAAARRATAAVAEMLARRRR
jgi:hypothetical protein